MNVVIIGVHGAGGGRGGGGEGRKRVLSCHAHPYVEVLVGVHGVCRVLDAGRVRHSMLGGLVPGGLRMLSAGVYSTTMAYG